MEIEQILNKIQSRDIVVPEFQREYVWSLEQSKKLMSSLFKEYPTGSILIWETDKPPEIKNYAVDKDKIGRTAVLLDGQQRLTTLYLLIRGDVPPYYVENDIANDPRHLYFNVKTGEFAYYQKQKMENNPFWISVIDCFKTELNAFVLVEKLKIEDPEEKFKIGENINTNLNSLRAIKKIEYHIQSIPEKANIDDAIDIFDRVNSLGTKLTDAELVLTHITGRWSQARRIMKEKIDYYNKVNFEFSLDFLTRCMIVVLNGSALFKKMTIEVYQKITENNYKEVWKKLVKILDYLIPILKQSAYLDGSDDMSTNNVLVPVIAYLANNEGRFLKDNKNKFIYWMFLASMWKRYSGQTDQKLDKDVYLAINSSNPVVELVKEIEDERGRIEVKPSDLEGRTAGHPLYKILYVVTKFNDAIDWANGVPLRETLGDYYSIQSHHIFPRSVLYSSGYDSQNHLDKKKVNEIANRAFITRDTNYDFFDKKPIEYLPKIIERYPESLDQQLIPKNKNLWKIENYQAFLKERRRLIANTINEFLNAYKEKKVKEEEVIDYKEIIKKGENNYVELKSSLRWNHENSKVDKSLERTIAKTLSAFMNSEGGKLFIGVSDKEEILGIDKDYSSLGKKNKDGFLLQMDQVVNKYLGKEFHQYMSSQIIEIDGKEICVVDITNSDMPVYVKAGENIEFYVRASASSQPMNMIEAAKYIKAHWNHD